MSERLPPQPTNTAVARLAGRIVAAVQTAAMLTPCVSLGAYRRLEARHDRAVNSIHAKILEISECNRQIRDLRAVNVEMSDRFTRRASFVPPAPDRLEIERRDNPLTQSIGHRIRIEFRPLSIEYRLPAEEMHRLRSKEEVREAVKRALLRSARGLAQAHANELEREIYAHALRCADLECVRL